MFFSFQATPKVSKQLPKFPKQTVYWQGELGKPQLNQRLPLKQLAIVYQQHLNAKLWIDHHQIERLIHEALLLYQLRNQLQRLQPESKHVDFAQENFNSSYQRVS